MSTTIPIPSSSSSSSSVASSSSSSQQRNTNTLPSSDSHDSSLVDNNLHKVEDGSFTGGDEVLFSSSADSSFSSNPTVDNNIKNNNRNSNNNNNSPKSKLKNNQSQDSFASNNSPDERKKGKGSTARSSDKGSVSHASSKEYDESDDLLSDYTSETTFFDEDRQISSAASGGASSGKEIWTFSLYKVDGKVHILGEWIARTKSYRYAVIGPDWPCVIMTYIVIVVPSVFVYLYIVHTLAEEIIFFILFGLCIFGLTTVFIADPGLVRKYHHARSRHWTYCDHCESFRPPGTVHCSTCQVCVAGYDHHCPWTGKCIGHGNIFFFKVFVISLSWLIILDIVLAILDAAGIQ